MKTITLTKRLQIAADMVRPGRRVADIGCDHGKLCAFLIVSGKNPFAIATDIRPMPLEKAKALFRQHAIDDQTKAVLCNGLAGVEEYEADDIVIAGLGFDVTASIIKDAAWLQNTDKHLILVPSSHHERLRKWLYANGYEIRQEQAVWEAGHCYAVMSVRYTGVHKVIEAVFAALGKIQGTDIHARQYIEKEYSKARKLADAVRTGQKADDARAVIQYIQKEFGLQ